MKQIIHILALCLIAALFLSGTGFAAENEEETMTNLEFFESLNYDDGLSVVTGTFARFPLQYAATLGLDGAPQLRPIEFKKVKAPDGIAVGGLLHHGITGTTRFRRTERALSSVSSGSS